MRGARAGFDSASFYRVILMRQRTAHPGSADREGHVRPRVLRSGRISSFTRRLYALLIAGAVSIVLYRALDPGFSPTNTAYAVDMLWLMPSLAGGALVGAILVVASASRDGLASVALVGMPALTPHARSIANGFTWAAVALLGVQFTAAAFDGLPGGHRLAGVVLGSAFGLGTFHLHRHAIEHEAYRTFNLVAMLLAAGSLASMSITPTGEWWTHNFSTLGTSNDLAAACFNVAIVVSGLGIAGLSGLLTRALTLGPFGLRAGARAVMRTLIALVGLGLMGVGLVPINGATELHNAFALGAAASFAALCVGVQLFASRLPRLFVCFSYASLFVETAAMVSYDQLGLFNLTVFELVAFTLVFAWLIALVVATATVHERDQRPADVAAPVARSRHRRPRAMGTPANPRPELLRRGRRRPHARFSGSWHPAAGMRIEWRDGRRPRRVVRPPRSSRPSRPARPARSSRPGRRPPRAARRRPRFARGRGHARIGRVESRHGYRHRRNRPQR